jgi:hypothetical protein
MMATRIPKEDWYRAQLRAGKFANSPSVLKYLSSPQGKFGVESQAARPAAQFGKRAAPPKQQQQKRASRTIVADTSGSVCFDDLRFKGGVAYATFAKDGSQYQYPMSRSDFKDWAADDLGKFFNEYVK